MVRTIILQCTSVSSMFMPNNNFLINMKKYTLISLFSFLIICMAGCQKGPDFGDVVYLTGTMFTSVSGEPVTTPTIPTHEVLGIAFALIDILFFNRLFQEEAAFILSGMIKKWVLST